MNYDKLMQVELNNFKVKQKLLLHSCCGPCSTSVIKQLIKYFDITVYFYNPNIEPKEEYEKRKNTQKELITKLNKNHNINFIEGDYENDLYHQTIRGLEQEKEGGARCNKCFYLRLDKTAKYAKENNYDYFATTLSVSPHKNSKLINELGTKLSKIYYVKYLVSDFKKRDGYKNSVLLSKEYKLYRQEYCGCIYSSSTTITKS